MPYNPYYIQKQSPIYNQGYYGAQMGQFQQQINPNAFSTSQGSFQPRSTQGPQTAQRIGGGTGALGAGVQGAAQIAGYISEGNSEANAVPNSINAQQEFDPWGKPVYNLGQDTVNLANTDTNVGKGMVGKSALAGATTGAAIGGVYGAAIGGVVGGIAGLIGQGAARKKARRRKAKAYSAIQSGLKDYNQQTMSYEQNNLSREAYNDQVRMNNPYQFPTNYY